MINNVKLKNFAKLVLKYGVNLQKNQPLEIVCPVEKSGIAHVFCQTAYEMGAKLVHVRWKDETIDKINYYNASTDALTDVPKWLIESKNHLVRENYCYIAVSAEDPTAFKDIPAQKITLISKAKSKALKKFSDQVMANAIRWCVVSVPTKAWADAVFPGDRDSVDRLSKAIEYSMRLNEPDPIAAWDKHIRKLDYRANFLNEKCFSYLHFTSKNGTDLKVGLADTHVWLSAKEKAKDGIDFIANMPTEEIFTSPHNKRIDGIVKSALPLSFNGQIVDDFSITFKKGKIVDFSAKKGYDILKGIIETDKGTRSLGEVALIGKNSPIAKSGILFYNTLFDENASCHLAIGKAYPTTVKNGDLLTVKELNALGANNSIEHVDFMIGSPDMHIIGVDKSGGKTVLFEDGDWVI